MGDPLKKLEERLQDLVPRGLGDSMQARLEAQIDELASGIVDAPRSGGWRLGLGIAAAVGAMAGVMIYSNVVKSGAGEVAASRPDANLIPASYVSGDPGFESLELERTVGDGEYGGIVLDRFEGPMHTWNHPVQELELVLDEESGLEVRIVQDRREQVQVVVTSF